jgi:hypothetical protein
MLLEKVYRLLENYTFMTKSVQILLISLFYKRGEISDEEDYLQFVLEGEKAYMQDVKKIAYELKKNL